MIGDCLLPFYADSLEYESVLRCHRVYFRHKGWLLVIVNFEQVEFYMIKGRSVVMFHSNSK